MPCMKHVLTIAVIALVVIYADRKLGLTAKLP
jgi:hypothetical protein